MEPKKSPRDPFYPQIKLFFPHLISNKYPQKNWSNTQHISQQKLQIHSKKSLDKSTTSTLDLHVTSYVLQPVPVSTGTHVLLLCRHVCRAYFDACLVACLQGGLDPRFASQFKVPFPQLHFLNFRAVFSSTRDPIVIRKPNQNLFSKPRMTLYRWGLKRTL